MSLLRRAAAVLLHNPACSKSRAALGLLQQSGAAFDTREYLQEPLSRAELEELQARLGQPTRWIRRGETAWAERFGDADAAPSDADCLTALAEAPALLERPIFVHGAFATVGRPPELVLALVGEPYCSYTYCGCADYGYGCTHHGYAYHGRWASCRLPQRRPASQCVSWTSTASTRRVLAIVQYREPS